MSVCTLALFTSVLAATAGQAAEPGAKGRTSPAIFLAGDTCRLEGDLEVQVEGRTPRERVPKGSQLAVTTSAGRFSSVQAGDTGGMVENAALARVCKIERPACTVRAPLKLRGVGNPKHAGKELQLQSGGTLRVLRHDAERAQVRVGQLDALVALPALLKACPSLAAFLLDKDDERRAESKDKAGVPTVPAGASAPQR